MLQSTNKIMKIVGYAFAINNQTHELNSLGKI